MSTHNLIMKIKLYIIINITYYIPISTLITNYADILVEKIKICIIYSHFFEGNFSVNPFFKNLHEFYMILTNTGTDNVNNE